MQYLGHIRKKSFWELDTFISTDDRFIFHTALTMINVHFTLRSAHFETGLFSLKKCIQNMLRVEMHYKPTV